MLRGVYFVLIFWISVLAVGQPKFNVTEYTTRDGLSQSTVMDILQDKKGFMWFATWDGLCKFDGYSFNTYKVRPGDSIQMSNSRIDQVVEDANGYIWALTYGRDVFRFDPVTETFSNVQSKSSNFSNYNYSVRSIQCLSDGTVWLITENEGTIKVSLGDDGKGMDLQLLSVKTELLEGNIVKKIVEDLEGNHWLLTNNGLTLERKGNRELESYFFENDEVQSVDKQSFYACHEEANEIWFGSIKGRLWRYKKKGGKFSLLQIPTASGINSIYKLKDGSYFFSTFEDGFFVYDINSNQFEHYNANSNKELAGNIVLEAYLTKGGDVWIQQNTNGITQFIPSKKEIIFHQVYHNPSFNYDDPDFFIVEDVNGHLWIHPHGGGFSFYDPNKRKLIPFNLDYTPKHLSPRRLHSLFSDQQGNLWYCPRSKGLNKITFYDDNFRFIKPQFGGESIESEEVRALFVDDKENLWVSTKNGRTTLYDKQQNYLGYLKKDGTVGKEGAHFNGIVYCIEQDDNGVMWLGTKGQGLFKLIARNVAYSYSIEGFSYNEDDLYSLSNNNIYHVYIDSKKRVWIATFGGGINLLTEDTNGKIQFINHRNNLNGYPINSCFRVRYITSDYNHNICIGTTNGLLVFNEDFVEPESITFKQYSFQAGDSSCLSNNDVHYIKVNKKRETYLATFGGGINKVSAYGLEGKFHAFTKKDGLPSEVLLAMIEDGNGNLWISTENELSKFNLTKKSFENFSESELGLPVLFSEASVTKDKEGFLYFGTNKGTLQFHPDSINKSSQSPSVALVEFKLFNKTIDPGDASAKLVKHIDDTERLVLKHNENDFTIGYAALEMKKPNKVQYAYMLEGFENQWNYVKGDRAANYTNLSHGEYIFRVKSTNGDGIWDDNSRQLKIQILPSFWQTNWAYVLYFVAFFIAGFVVIYIFITIYHLKNEVKVENQLTEMKLRFFTDISHELRTPLTLITGPVEQVLQDKNLSVETREQIKLVESNSKRMLRLINQLMDFAKLRNKKMQLKVREVELIGFLHQLMDNFKTVALQKNIEFKLENNKEEAFIWVDEDKLEKILFNLLSNAFKYIKGGKSVHVIVEDSAKEVIIKVKDTGAGIKADKQKAIFGRFENWVGKGAASIPSSGIGLSVVKQLVELHKGKVSLVSQEDVGSEFSVSFLKGYNHYNEEVEIIVNDSLDEHKPKFEITENIAENEEAKGEKPSVLLVEDNPEVRLFIRKVLQKNYHITEACDGQEAIEVVTDLLPDLIISDLMMPRVNGVEFLTHVRGDMNTSHTPFIILSAKSSLDSQLEGLDKGADAYVTKPFSTSYLLGRVKNLLEQRQKLHEYYKGTGDDKKLEIEPTKVQVTSLDKEFMVNLMGIMEKNMDNGALVVDDLVKEIAVSRSVFFKKLKSLTGMAPIEFIKEVRLKRAAQLIEESQYNITQIAYMVGINDSRYFSKCFKSRFGLTPTKYREQFLN